MGIINRRYITNKRKKTSQNIRVSGYQKTHGNVARGNSIAGEIHDGKASGKRIPSGTRQNKAFKDSLFRYLFKQVPNFIELYKATHPDDMDITEADFEEVSLKQVFTRCFYNDVAFRVRGKTYREGGKRR